MILYVSDKSVPKERGAWLVAAYFVVYGIAHSLKFPPFLTSPPVSLTISNYIYVEKVRMIPS
jgi:hypothetical protein